MIKNKFAPKTIISLLLLLIFNSSCNDQKQNINFNNTETNSNFKEQTVQPLIKKTKNYQQNETVRSGILDKQGNLWFATYTEGVYRYDGKSFTQFTEQDGLSNNNVSAILEDNYGNLWFATADGICKYDHSTFTTVPVPNENRNIWGKEMGSQKVLCLLQDSQGFIWFGTWGGGAYRFDPSVVDWQNSTNFTSFLADKGRIQEDGKHHHVIQSIMEDSQGNIWFTSMTHGGISRFDGEQFTHFTPKDGLSDDMYFSCFQDKAGNIWFGSLGNRNGSLDRYDGNSFTNFNETDGLCNNNTISIYEDQRGYLWLGSARGELCIYDGTNFTPFRTSHGRTFERTGFILEDKDGAIWFGANYGGLFRYDPTETSKTGGIFVTDFTQKGNG